MVAWVGGHAVTDWASAAIDWRLFQHVLIRGLDGRLPRLPTTRPDPNAHDNTPGQ